MSPADRRIAEALAECGDRELRADLRFYGLLRIQDAERIAVDLTTWGIAFGLLAGGLGGLVLGIAVTLAGMALRWAL